MSAVSVAIADLLKHYLITYEWAKDKHTNTLINGVALALLATISTAAFWKGWFYRVIFIYHTSQCFAKCRRRRWCGSKTAVAASSVEAYLIPESMEEEAKSRLTHAPKCVCITWNASEPFSDAIATFMSKHYTRKCSIPAMYDVEKEELGTVEEGFDQPWKRFLRNTGFLRQGAVPIYMHGSDIVAMQEGKDCISLLGTSEACMKAFVTLIKTNFYVKTTQRKEKDSNLVYIYCDGTGRRVFPNRTLDAVVTRHMPMIRHYLKDFQAASKDQKSAFNGFGTYNLGIMLYGPPGTGKTSLIRALCVETNRNGVMVNLRTTKTMKQLRDVFKSANYVIEETVYIFEEFDYVQGIFTQQDPLNQPTVDAGTACRNRIAELTAMMHKDLDATAQTALKDQIAREETRLSELEDAITLDNMLLLLDGLQEVRSRIIVATTNHIHKINPALLRDGRFDIKVELGKFNQEETRELLTKMFPDENSTAKIQATTFPHEKWACVEIISLCHKLQHLDVILAEMGCK